MLTTDTQSITTQFRDQFPVTERLVYLNHAAVSPLCKPAAEAIKRLADDALLFGSYHYDQWLDAYQGLRVAAAKLINAESSEIALVKNTSEGIAMVANGLDWKPGDRIVAFEEEFPANFWPWKRLERKGLHVDLLPATATLDRIEDAARRARLLSISFVQFLSGYRADLDSIGDICHRNDCLFFVDAIQGMGAFPLDVRRSRIHALAADGHKWMTGPEGCGVLYIQRDLQDRIEPVEFGWTNTAHFNDYRRDDTLRPDAGRYECGTLNTIGIFGLRAAIEFLLQVGVDRIAPVVQGLGDRIAEGVRAKGYELLGTRTPANGAGIVTFRHPSVDARKIVRDLKDQGFIAAPRQGWVRTSPHFYIAQEEIARFLDALP